MILCVETQPLAERGLVARDYVCLFDGVLTPLSTIFQIYLEDTGGSGENHQPVTNH